MSAALLATAGAIGALHLATYYTGQRAIAGVLKALPIVLLAWGVASSPHAGAYGRLVTAGLLLSAVGDVSLVFRSGFLPGLASFFAAHCCYVAAFLGGAVARGPGPAVAFLVLAAVAVGMLRYLWPHVRRVRIAVVAYVTVLVAMAWCAIARAAAPTTPSASGTLAALGAMSFVVSDGVLAVDRFARPFAGAHAVVMVTYYLAQGLIAASAA